MMGSQILRLNINEIDRAFIDENKIEHQKIVNKALSKAKKESKADTCRYCGEKTGSFCNSHTLPAFCLRNIAEGGEVLLSNSLVDFPLMDKENGVKKAGTFQLICRACDSKIFQDYEEPENYEKKPSQKMLAQIAMKNSLKYIAKREYEFSIFNLFDSNHPLAEAMHEVQKQDLKEYEESYELAKKRSLKSLGEDYYLIHYEKLDYVTPIAFQGNISLVQDFDGKIVNDIFCKDTKYRIMEMHICIFPLKEETVVMMFIDSKYQKRYRSFYKKFKKLLPIDKLSVINYMLFLYSEDIFLSKGIEEAILKNTELIETAQVSGMAISDSEFGTPLDTDRETYNLSKHDKIPNLLSKEYKLR